MATQYAFIADNGEVRHVVSPGSDSDYIEGNLYNGLLAVAVGIDTDVQTLMQTKYYKDNKWYTRKARSSAWQDWDGTAWVFNADRFAAHIRLVRNNLLGVCDWTQLPDAPLSTETKNKWAVYRQTLRDLPEVYSAETELDSIVWPTTP